MHRPGKTSWRARLSALAQQMPASRRRQRWTLIARLARQSNRQYVRNILEGGIAWYWPQARIASRFDAPVGQAHLDAARAAGRGVIVALPHFGAWELLGLHLGYINPAIVPVGLFYGFVIGAVVGVVAVVAGGAGRKTALPFGPFLAAGTVVAVFAGQWFVDLVWQG